MPSKTRNFVPGGTHSSERYIYGAKRENKLVDLLVVEKVVVFLCLVGIGIVFYYVFLCFPWCSDKQTRITLSETNILAPENSSSQKEITSSNHGFSVAMLVSGSVDRLG